MKVFTVKDDVFKVEPVFVGNCSQRAMRTYLGKTYGVPFDESDMYEDAAALVLSFRRAPWRVVWLESMSRSVDDIARLGHELFHLVVRICADRGVPIKANIETGECGDEAAAYLLDFYLRGCLRKIR